MVDLTFTSRARHFIPLALLRLIADLPPSEVPEELAYIGQEGIKALKGALRLWISYRLEIRLVTWFSRFRNGSSYPRPVERAKSDRRRMEHCCIYVGEGRLGGNEYET